MPFDSIEAKEGRFAGSVGQSLNTNTIRPTSDYQCLNAVLKAASDTTNVSLTMASPFM